MEAYIPYIIYSGLSTYLGKVAYDYYNKEEVIEDDNQEKNIEYKLIDSKLVERVVDSKNDKRSLGITLKEKIANIQKICKEECGRHYVINNTKKVRGRWLRYIREYERVGHSEFVLNHK